MKVIGIDPAPSKDATIYDGTEWSQKSAHELPSYIDQLSRAQEYLLVCWEAPLTTGKKGMERCYSQRMIESFFCTKKYGFKAPKGISVLPYSGCPHWAVTQAAVGLPQTGKFNGINIPFNLCASGGPPKTGKNIVEVHPAVAIWLWCKGGQNAPRKWTYKDGNDVLAELWGIIAAIASKVRLAPQRAPNDDDEFDAYVAWLLGTIWLASKGVILLGSADTGSFLVPDISSLQNKFGNFVK